MVKLINIILFLLLALVARAQKIDAFARAEVNTKRVVVEQPVKVKIKVYSSTWFAKPLSFQNLQVEGAYVQSFKRTQSSIEYINKKKYAALEFYYVLFPYTSGEIIFPEIILTTSIPPENDYKGQPVTLKTKAIKIIVDPPPADADVDHWLVATNARISNKWSANLNTLNVGDVVNRTITIAAEGTLPTFIDEPIIDVINFGSIYTSEPKFYDDRDDKNVNGRRVDNYAYLLEEVGEFTLPEVEITWWNPYMGKYYKRKLPSYTLTIGENPEMSSLQQLKDSLNSLNPIIDTAKDATDTGPKWFEIAKKSVVVLMYLLLIVFAFFISKFIYTFFIRRRKQYLASESYLFSKVLQQKDEKGLLNSIYYWLDHSKGPITISTLSKDDPELDSETMLLKRNSFSKQSDGTTYIHSIKKRLKRLRKSFKKSKKASSKNSKLSNLNP